MRGTMLEISKSDMFFVQKLLQESDDMGLQLLAYHAQQAVEKALKYAYSHLGKRTPKTHDIRALLEGLSDVEEFSNSPLIADLTLRADTLTMWEEKTRYPNDYMATRKSVEEMVPYIEELIAFIEAFCAPKAKHGHTGIRDMNLF